MNTSAAASQAKKTGGIKDMDRRYFREIFMLHAVDEKINYEGLCKIFEMVDFKPNEKQEAEFKAMFTKKEFLGFTGKPRFSNGYRLPSNFQLEEQPEVQRGRRQECLPCKWNDMSEHVAALTRV